ncbi:NAD(P)H-binding protein [Brevibacterium litoralis]|uniref:NAD(P)H-binding protein n=1 Tax=Brevibacterium litoralis TaxID=3138935 RepID=UPI0032F06A00
MTTTLVIGASGYEGRYLVAELHRRGHTVRALVRDRERAEEPHSSGAPSLAGLVDEWRIGEITDAAVTADLAAGVDAVVSALGVTTQDSDPWQVDHAGNLQILQSAAGHGAEAFLYLGAIGADRCPAEVAKAKTAFVRDLAGSRTTGVVVHPSGYFSDMSSVLDMARKGHVRILDPEVRLNPIHGADLAAYCVDRLEEALHGRGASAAYFTQGTALPGSTPTFRVYEVGGPEVLTWQEIGEAAFEALGTRPRISRIPRWLVSLGLRVSGMFSARLADVARWLVHVLTHDAIGERTGTHRLRDHFAAEAPRTP